MQMKINEMKMKNLKIKIKIKIKIPLGFLFKIFYLIILLPYHLTIGKFLWYIELENSHTYK